ncbi:MAG TPA: NAD-dependent epimerase/dehydratase family protein [Drouetiella sp.]
MKHLVTGGSGYLGNLIARRFAARGDQVIALDLWKDDSVPAGIQFVHGDVTDRDMVRQVMQGVDIVHHTAALVPLTKSGGKFDHVNAEGSRIVAEEAAAAKVEAFIHLSSSAIFGTPDCPADNSSPLGPKEIYGKSKLEGERAVQAVAEKSGMKLISVRPRTIIGKERLGIFQILFDWIKDNANIFVIGDGSNKIQFVHTDDLIDAYMLVHDVGKPGLYNMGTDRFGTLRDDLEALCRHAGSNSHVRSLPKGLTISTLSLLDQLGLSPLAPWHYLTYGEPFYFDVSELKQLGWQPKYSNLEMLQESYDSFVAGHDELMKQKGGSAHRKPVKQSVLAVAKIMSRLI